MNEFEITYVMPLVVHLSVHSLAIPYPLFNSYCRKLQEIAGNVNYLTKMYYTPKGKSVPLVVRPLSVLKLTFFCLTDAIPFLYNYLLKLRKYICIRRTVLFLRSEGEKSRSL